MKELICIVCPKGCHLKINEEDLSVTGNACPRGDEYAKNELTAPTRMITSTVIIKNALYPRCSVKTSMPIPKHLIFDAMKTLDKVVLCAPVAVGQIVVENVCETGANFVVTHDMNLV